MNEDEDQDSLRLILESAYRPRAFARVAVLDDQTQSSYVIPKTVSVNQLRKDSLS